MRIGWFSWCWLPVLVGCADPTGTGFPSSSQPLPPGQRLYLEKCASCHRFYHPARYTEEQWRSWMDRMAAKAKLTPEQKATVEEYLEQFRRQPDLPTPR